MLKQVIVGIMVVMLLVMGGQVSAQQPVLPEGVLALIETPGLQAIQDHVQAYASAISPTVKVPPPAVMLTQMTMTINPMTIDASQPIQMVFIAGEQGIPLPVLIFSVTDIQAYKASLTPTLKQPVVEGKVTVYQNQRGVQGTTPAAIAIEGNTVCASQDKAAVETAISMVSGGQLGGALLLGGTDDIAAHIQTKALLDSITASMGSPFNILRSQFMGAMAGAPPETAQQTQAIVHAEIDALEALMGQIQSNTLRVNAQPDALRLSLELDAIPGTPLAAYLSSVPDGMPDTLKYVPNDTFLLGTFKMGDMASMMSWLIDFQTRMMAAQGTPPEESEKILNSLKDMMHAYGSELTFGMQKGARIRLVEAIRLKDPAAAAQMTNKAPTMADGWMRMYQRMGINMDMQIQPNRHTHGATSIAEWAFNIAPQPANEGANPQQQAMAEMQKKMMTAMFGEGMTMHSAVFGEDWLISVGDGSLDSIKAMIDNTGPRLMQDAAFRQNVLAVAPSSSEGILFVRLTELIPWAMSLAQSASGMMPPMLANLKLQPGPGVVGVLDISQTNARFDLSVPAVEIKSIVDGFQQAMMQGMQPQGAGDAPPPGPVR